MDLAALSGLLTPQGWALLEALPPYDERTAIPLSERLRREGHDPVMVAAAMTQSRLRARARSKFGSFADGMLFTPEGLEQATRLVVAARHAQRFASAGVARVHDLGCGIGADAMAFAGLDRTVLAFESDAVTAAIATVNLRHFPDSEVRCLDILTAGLDEVLAGADGAWLDPARRDTGGRRLDPQAWSPPLSTVLEVAGRVGPVGAKVAPGIHHRELPAGVEAQWVSVGGEVVEAALWFGSLARDGVDRSALLLQEDGSSAELSGTGREQPPGAGDVGSYLMEPDGAVIRAGLVAALADRLVARLVDPTIAYLTTDVAVSSPFVHCYQVLDVQPFHLKRLRAYLRDRDVGRLTVKKRGTAVDPDQLRAQLRLSGPAEATIVLTRLRGQQSVLVVRPVPAEQG